MLRDDRQTALNDVILACTEAADGHSRAAQLVEAQGLARVLEALAEQRTAAAEELGEHLKTLGDLPKAPDSDLAAIRELVERVSAALSSDERTRLVEERERAEATVEEAVTAALDDGLPTATRDVLVRLREETRLARERLGDWRERPDAG